MIQALIILASLIAATWAFVADAVLFPPDSTLCMNGGCRIDRIETAIDTMGLSPRTVDAIVATDPANPFAWSAYGEMLNARGETGKAAAAFARATTLGPGTAAVWMRAANFYFTHNRTELGFVASAHVLSQTELFDQVVFSYLTATGAPAAKLLGTAVPAESRSARSWLTWIESHGSDGDMTDTWSWMRTRGLGDEKAAVQLTQTLWDGKKFDAAQKVWADWLGNRRGDYLQSQFIGNRRFENAPSGSPFDWTLEASPGVGLERIAGLEVRFLGTENVDLRGVRQFAVLRPGRYVFRAEIEADGITTDEGPYFRIADAVDDRRLSVETGRLLGDRGRAWMEVSFTVPAATSAIEVELRRKPTLRFDNRISGRLKVFETALLRADHS